VIDFERRGADPAIQTQGFPSKFMIDLHTDRAWLVGRTDRNFKRPFLLRGRRAGASPVTVSAGPWIADLCSVDATRRHLAFMPGNRKHTAAWQSEARFDKWPREGAETATCLTLTEGTRTIHGAWALLE